MLVCDGVFWHFTGVSWRRERTNCLLATTWAVSGRREGWQRRPGCKGILIGTVCLFVVRSACCLRLLGPAAKKKGERGAGHYALDPGGMKRERRRLFAPALLCGFPLHLSDLLPAETALDRRPGEGDNPRSVGLIVAFEYCRLVFFPTLDAGLTQGSQIDLGDDVLYKQGSGILLFNHQMTTAFAARLQTEE